MFRDITLGQYYPVESPIHRLDPRVKIMLTMGFIALAIIAGTLIQYALVFFILALVTLLSKIPAGYLLRSLKPVFFILIFTFILNVIFVQGGPVYFSIWFINVSELGVRTAVFMAMRLSLLVAGTSLLTLTTSPLGLTEGLERLLRPLNLVKFPVHEMSMMMTIALRFIPTLAEEADRIMKAQSARGADFDTGGPIKRAMNLVPLLVPLFISAFRRADDLAVAMEARCYNGGKGRTKLKVFKTHPPDYIAIAVMAASIASIAAGWVR